MNFLRLADHQAQVVGKLRDRAGAADFVPGLRLDGRGDQIDQGVEVGLAPPPRPPGPKGDRLLLARWPGAMPPAAMSWFIWAMICGSMMPLACVPSRLARSRCRPADSAHAAPRAAAHVVGLGQAPARPMRPLGTKFGIGMTRSATL